MINQIISSCLKPLRGLGLKEKLYNHYAKWHDVFCEWRMGISTVGIKRNTLHKDAVSYEPVPYTVIFPVLAALGVSSENTFADIGCGKGRVVCAAMTLNFAEVIGVEIDEELAQIAQANVKKMQSKNAVKNAGSIDNVSATARRYENIDRFFLYNPFGAETVEAFLTIVAQEQKKNPAKIKIAYVNPVHFDVFKKFDWLRLENEWPESRFPGFYVWPRENGAPMRAVQIWASV